MPIMIDALTEWTQSKYRLIKHLEETEGINIFPSSVQDQKLTERGELTRRLFYL